MGYPTKVQLIKRKKSEQWYVNFPSAMAQAMEFRKGELFEWIIENRALTVLRRMDPPDSVLKKKRDKDSSSRSRTSGGKAAPSANKTGSDKRRRSSP